MCGRPVHSIDCPGRLTVRRHAQLALEHRTVARRAHGHRRSRTAGSAAAPRSSPAAAGGFSAPAPLHGTIPRRPSQRSHASRKCMAQLSLGSRRRQGHLEHDMYESISNSCQHACRHRWRAPPGLLTSWAMGAQIHTQGSTTSGVPHRVREAPPRSAGSPGRSRRHSQRRFSHLPGHPMSGP